MDLITSISAVIILAIAWRSHHMASRALVYHWVFRPATDIHLHIYRDPESSRPIYAMSIVNYDDQKNGSSRETFLVLIGTLIGQIILIACVPRPYGQDIAYIMVLLAATYSVLFCFFREKVPSEVSCTTYIPSIWSQVYNIHLLYLVKTLRLKLNSTNLLSVCLGNKRYVLKELDVIERNITMGRYVICDLTPPIPQPDERGIRYTPYSASHLT